MDQQTWDAVVNTVRSTHESLMLHGQVMPPQLLPVVDGALVGHVSLRPVIRGHDAIKAVAEMSNLVAAAQADEIIVAWEKFDLDIACGHARWEHRHPELHILWATPQTYVLHGYPYEEQLLPDPAPSGLRRAVPQWAPAPPPEQEAELPPAIAALVHFSWKPLGSDDPDLLDHAATLLEAEGYDVALTVRSGEAGR
jgi:hypothetical protein